MMESQTAWSRQPARSLQISCMMCSTRYGYTKSNLQRGKCPLCSQSTRVVTNIRLIQPNIVASISVAHWLNCLRECVFLGWLNSQKPAVRWQTINLEHALSDKSTMLLHTLYHSIQHIAEGSCNIRCSLWLFHRVPNHSPRKTPFPAMQREIVGRMWKHLRERSFHIVKVCVLHPRIPKSSSVVILRGVPEGSRLSPTLFRILWLIWSTNLKCNS